MMVVFDNKQRQNLIKYMEDDKMVEELTSAKIEQLNKIPKKQRFIFIKLFFV